MTVGPKTDIRQAVNALLRNGEVTFSSVNWQLDAQFWQSDYEEDKVMQWFERYNGDVRALVDDWSAFIDRTGQIPRIYPFLGIIDFFLTGNPSKLRFWAGWTEFNIQTDGNITPCPVMAGIEDFYLGDIWKSDPRNLKDSL